MKTDSLACLKQSGNWYDITIIKTRSESEWINTNALADIFMTLLMAMTKLASRQALLLQTCRKIGFAHCAA